MKKIFALLTPLFFLFMVAGSPAYAGFSGQPTVSVAKSSTITPTTSPSKTVKWYEKAAQSIVKPFKAMGGDLNILGFIVGIFLPVVTSWKLFTKAGIPGWWTLIPIGGTIKFLQMIDKHWTHIFWLLVPFVNIYKAFVWNMDLAEKFGKERMFGIGVALLYPIFGGLLAWDGANSYK